MILAWASPFNVYHSCDGSSRDTYMHSVPEWYVNYVIWTHKASLNYVAEQLDFDQQKRV